MKLTRFQKRYLASLVYLHQGRASLFRILCFRPFSWVPMFAAAAFAWYSYTKLDRAWGLFSIGLVLGGFARIVGQARFTLLAWPVTEQVVDWKKVEGKQMDDY